MIARNRSILQEIPHEYYSSHNNANTDVKVDKTTRDKFVHPFYPLNMLVVHFLYTPTELT